MNRKLKYVQTSNAVECFSSQLEKHKSLLRNLLSANMSDTANVINLHSKIVPIIVELGFPATSHNIDLVLSLVSEKATSEQVESNLESHPPRDIFENEGKARKYFELYQTRRADVFTSSDIVMLLGVDFFVVSFHSLGQAYLDGKLDILQLLYQIHILSDPKYIELILDLHKTGQSIFFREELDKLIQNKH